MNNAACLFPELVIKDEKPTEAESEHTGECQQHIWLKPEGDANPDVVAKCRKCGMLMVHRPRQGKQQSV